VPVRSFQVHYLSFTPESFKSSITHMTCQGVTASGMLRWATSAPCRTWVQQSVSPCIQDLRIIRPYIPSGFSALMTCSCPLWVSPLS